MTPPAGLHMAAYPMLLRWEHFSSLMLSAKNQNAELNILEHMCSLAMGCGASGLQVDGVDDSEAI